MWHYAAGDRGFLRLYSYPVVEDYKSLWDVPNLLLQKTPSDNFTATMILTFSPDKRYTGERTGLVVMGLDYAGLILENTLEGLVFSQFDCQKADQGKTEFVNATLPFTDNTTYLRVNVY